MAWSHPSARSQLSVLEMFVIRRLLLICLRVLKIFKNKNLNQQRKSLNDFLMKSFPHRKSQFWLHRGPLQDPWDRLHLTPELTITDVLAFESHFTKDGNYSVFVFVCNSLWTMAGGPFAGVIGSNILSNSVFNNNMFFIVFFPFCIFLCGIAIRRSN